SSLVPPPFCRLGSGLERDPVGDAVQPARQRVVLAERVQALDEQEERGLEGVLRVLPLRQYPPADAVDHRPVPPQQGREYRFVPLPQTAFHEVAIRAFRQRLRGRSARQLAKEGA